MDLEIDITINSTGTIMWVEDKSDWYDLTGFENLSYDEYVSAVTIYFKDYIDSDGTANDIDESIDLNVVAADHGSLANRFFEIDAVDLGFTIFPEGVYNIKFSVSTVGSIPIPDNNDNYYYAQAIYTDLQTYYDELLLKVAREHSKAISDDYLFWYINIFRTKMMALEAAIDSSGTTEYVEPEDIKVITSTIKYLQDLQTKYPDSNDTRRYYKYEI